MANLPDTQYRMPSLGGGAPNNLYVTNNGSAPGPTYNAGWEVSPEQLATILAGRNGNSAVGPYADRYRFDGSQNPPTSFANDLADPSRTLSRVQVPMGTLDTSGPRYTSLQPSANGGSDGGNDGSPGGGGLPVWARALAAAPAIANQLSNSGGSGSGVMSPELQQLLALALKRMSGQQGLFDSINAQAMAGLPSAYQR